MPFFIKPITRQIASRVDNLFLNENFKTQFGFLEEQLKTSPDGGQYLCGKDLTAADILMVSGCPSFIEGVWKLTALCFALQSFPLIAGAEKIDEKLYPTLTGYRKLLQKNEVHQRSVKKLEEITGEQMKSML